MNLNQLNAFRVLAGTLHYSRAAEELEIAQPSLSRIIGQLEQELGTNLFEKQGRNIILTKQGAIFAEYIRRGLNEIEQGTLAVRELMDPGFGTVDFAFIYALSPTYVPHLIKKFLSEKAHQKIQFRFYQGNSRDIIHKIKDGSCDVGFCSYVEEEPLIELRPIVKQEYVLMVSRKHPLAKKSTVSLEEAAQYDFILPLDKTSYVEQQFRRAGITPRAASRVEEDHAAAALVSINLGIAVIPKNTILEHYDVKLIPFGPKPLYRKFYMASAKGRTLTPSSEVFYQFLLEESRGRLPVY